MGMMDGMEFVGKLKDLLAKTSYEEFHGLHVETDKGKVDCPDWLIAALAGGVLACISGCIYLCKDKIPAMIRAWRGNGSDRDDIDMEEIIRQATNKDGTIDVKKLIKLINEHKNK